MKVSEERGISRSGHEDDVAIVLEAIDFMLTLESLSPEDRRRLDQVKVEVERRTTG
jgi:hypothetical protein